MFVRKLLKLNKNHKIILIVGVGLITGFVLISQGNILGRLAGKKDLQVYASEILETCSKEPYAPGCYDREVPKLMKYLSMEETFDVVKLIQEESREYLFCHVVAHAISDVETKKDPSKWMEVVSRCPVTMCNNGCPHGAIMERFQSETLSEKQIAQALPDLKNVCEPREGWNPTEVERSMCYHGGGHVGMYVTGGDVDKSLELCREIAIKDDGRNYYQTCVQGIFMLVFQGLEPEDFALVADIKPEKEELEEYCGQYSGTEFFACRTEAWPLFFSEIKTPEGLVNFCSFTGDHWGQTWCYGTGFGLISLELLERGENSGVEAVSDYCMALPDTRQAQCYANASSRFVQVDPKYTEQAVALCELAEKFGKSEYCYHDLLFYSRYSFHEGSQALKEYCGHFDEIRKKKCLDGDVPNEFYFFDTEQSSF